MASYLRPRRGKKATAIAQLTASAPLKRGEVFFEVPDGGTGTGAGRIKMGDGSTAYESLPYFLEPFDPDSATVGFTNATAAESDPYTTNATHTNAIVPTANLKTILTNLKQLLLNYNSQFTKLNNDLEKTNQSLVNIMPSGDMNILFNFSNKATSGGGVYITNSVYMPKNLTFTLSEVVFIGSSGNFVNQVAVKRNGNYINLSATNSAFAGLTVSCVGTIS